MFGYVRPVLNRLSEEDRASYQSAYCGLCHAMGRRHGFLTRFTLNYDFAFLAILISGGRGVSGTCAMRCPVHPIRRPQQCLAGAGLDVTADESVILTWYKLTDDVQDHGLVTGLPYRLIRRLFRRAYRRAALARPCFDQQVGAGMERLRQMEKERSPRLDRVADAFAGILAAAVPDRCLTSPAVGPWSRCFTTWGGGSIWRMHGTIWMRTGGAGDIIPWMPVFPVGQRRSGHM